MRLIQSVLHRLGLSEKESNVYQTLLTTGASSASVLCQRVGLPRSTTQFTCQQLVDKGFLSLTRKNGAILYAPEPPEKILLLLERQRFEIDQREEQIRGVMSELKQLMHPSTSQPKVRFYEGKDGLAACWDELLDEAQKGDEILGYVHPLDETSDPLQLLPVVDRYIAARAEKKIFSRLIASDIPLARTLQAHDKTCFRETRIITGRATTAPTEIMLHGNRMYIRTITSQNVFASIVENADLVALQKAAFEGLWERLGE